MTFFQKIHPELVLRAGLGVMYLYSGQDLVRHPTAWIWAIPFWLRTIIASVMDIEIYLVTHGVIEIILALALLSWFLPRGWIRIAVWISVLEFAAILALAFLPFSEANFLITFRDIGLLAASLALVILISKNNGTTIKSA